MKKHSEAMEDFKSQIYPVAKFSVMNLSRAVCSIGDNGYILQFFIRAPEIGSIM